MNKYLSLIIFVSAAGIFTGCASTNETADIANANANSAVVSTTGNQNLKTTENGLVLAPGAEKIDPNAFNASGGKEMPIVRRNPEDDKDSNYRGRSAPDNSTFSTTMNAKGQAIETRTFLNHPQLAKVERIFITPNEKVIKIYLKSGKTVEVPGEKLPNFSADAPQNILLAAGIKSSAPVSQPKNEEKKQEQN